MRRRPGPHLDWMVREPLRGGKGDGGEGSIADGTRMDKGRESEWK